MDAIKLRLGLRVCVRSRRGQTNQTHRFTDILAGPNVCLHILFSTALSSREYLNSSYIKQRDYSSSPT